MKNLPFLIIFTLSSTLFAQDKTTTTFTVNTTKNDSINKLEFSNFLLDNDYFINKETTTTITTELQPTKTKPRWSYKYHYRIRFKDNKIILKPFWTTGINLDIGVVQSTAQLYPWHWSKRKNNIEEFIFNETLALLKNSGYQEIIFK